MAGNLASRVARFEKTFLVTSAIALEVLATDLDGSLDQLEDLCVSYADS